VCQKRLAVNGFQARMRRNPAMTAAFFHNARRETRWTPNPLRPSPRR
jgi:hypothetical protein